MGFPQLGLSSVRRSFEILFTVSKLAPRSADHPPDFTTVARDIKVSRISKNFFKTLSPVAGIGCAYFAFTAALPTACLLGAVFLISLASMWRFSILLKQEDHVIRWMEPILRVIDASYVDWGRGVLNAETGAICAYPQLSARQQLACLSNLFHYYFPNPNTRPGIRQPGEHTIIPSHGVYIYDESIKANLRAVLEKCWTFALRQVNPSLHFQACFLCAYGETRLEINAERSRLVTFKFGQVDLALPNYLKNLIIREQYLEGCIDERGIDAAEIVVTGMDAKKFIKLLRDNVLVGMDPLDVIYHIRTWVGRSLMNRLTFLKTLDDSEEDQSLREIIGSRFFIPYEVELDASLLQEMIEAKISDMVINSDRFTPDHFALLRRLNLRKLEISNVTQEQLREISSWNSLEELVLTYPAFNAEELTALPALNVKKLTLKYFEAQISPGLVAWLETMPNLEDLTIKGELGIHHADRLKRLKEKKPRLIIKTIDDSSAVIQLRA